MSGSDQPDGSAGGGTQPKWVSWQDAIRWRLARSATVALLLSPIGLVLISVTRLLIVSDYNTVTASAIVSSGGYVDALLGTIIPVVPFALPYIVLALLFFNRVILSILAMLATALVSPIAADRAGIINVVQKDWQEIIGAPVIFDIIMGLLAFLVIVILLAMITAMKIASLAKTLATIACIALIPFISQVYAFPVGGSYYTSLIRQPWLPAETITFASGHSIVGYVLADDGSTVTVLLDRNRAVTYYPDSTVTGRRVCAISHTLKTRPLIALLPAGTRPPKTPLCRPAPLRSPQAGRLSRAAAVIRTASSTASARFLRFATGS